MKHVKKSVLLWYSPHQMYALVTDVESYPKFLPWCSRAEVLQRHPDGLTALRFRSKRSRTYGFHQTPPSRGIRVRAGPAPLPHRCRVPSIRAPGLDLHLLSVDHADRTGRRRAQPGA